MQTKNLPRSNAVFALSGAAILLLIASLLVASAASFGCQRDRDEDCEPRSEDDRRCKVVRGAPSKGEAPAPAGGATSGRATSGSATGAPSPAAAEPTRTAVEGPAAVDGPAAVPGLPLAALTAAQRALFWSVVEDQFDPCGKPRSFGETLRAGDREACPLAWTLARWVAGRARVGDERRAIVYGLLERLRREHDRATFRLDGRPRKGPADAAVTVVEFYDYGCPYCRELEEDLAALRKQNPDVAFVLKQLPLEYHAGADRAALALLAAERQGKAWELHRALFAAPSLEDDAIVAAAKRAGLDLERFRSDWGGDAVAALVREDVADADAALVQGTPTFFVNGVEVAFDELEARIREAREAPPAK